MHIVTKTCSCCGNTFTTDIPRQTYCSVACRNTQNTRIKRQRKEARKARAEVKEARATLEGKAHLSIISLMSTVRRSASLTMTMRAGERS